MNKPTEAQIKEPTKEEQQIFWERYGVGYVQADDGRTVHISTRLLDLKNLFKYAVPKAKRLKPKGWLTGTLQGIFESNNDPALALFWALWSIIRGGKKMAENKGLLTEWDKRVRLLYCKWCPHDCKGLTNEEKCGCVASGGFSDEFLPKMLEVVEGAGLTEEEIMDIVTDYHFSGIQNRHILANSVAKAQLQAILKAIKEGE